MPLVCGTFSPRRDWVAPMPIGRVACRTARVESSSRRRNHPDVGRDHIVARSDDHDGRARSDHDDRRGADHDSARSDHDSGVDYHVCPVRRPRRRSVSPPQLPPPAGPRLRGRAGPGPPGGHPPRDGVRARRHPRPDAIGALCTGAFSMSRPTHAPARPNTDRPLGERGRCGSWRGSPASLDTLAASSVSEVTSPTAATRKGVAASEVDPNGVRALGT